MIIVKQSGQHQSNQTTPKKNKLGKTPKENTTPSNHTTLK
jgi:hypothetical protein